MFISLDDGIYVAPQISTAQVAEAQALGVTLIINNRPDGEAPDQVAGAEIEAAATAAGIAYIAIPITHSGFSEPQVHAMVDALDSTDGAVLAYCRSGTRSTNLWALAMASLGEHPAILSEKAEKAGYDISALTPLMDMLRARA